jgi:virulence-associated protein VagC
MTHTAKLFRNGRSQAVRLPADYRFPGSEVYVRRDPATGDVILSRRPDSWQDFFDLADSLDLTVFMITHDLDSLYAVTDRVAVLADKKVVAVAPVRELENYDHPWVREYFHGPRGRARAQTDDTLVEPQGAG